MNAKSDPDKNRPIIIRMIAKDLKISRVFQRFQDIGLSSLDLYTRTYEEALMLMRFSENEIDDNLNEWYFEQSARVHQIKTVYGLNDLMPLATEIYEGLHKMKVKHKGKDGATAQ